MKCPKCGSENVQIQSREYKPKLTGPILLVFIGFGTMFLGIAGAIAGALLGLIVSAIVKAVIPQAYQSVLTCQDCGYSGTVENCKTATRPDEESEYNLRITRKPCKTGSAVLLSVKVDDKPQVDIANGGSARFNLPDGIHTVYYQQKSGLGKENRHGSIAVDVSTGKKMGIQISFTRNGIDTKIGEPEA
jgi:predicted nucleic-acid-binding Zn-ribbon protein|nr:MAG TPA: Protein of unknown function (DUF2846) [Caudoviricetes sp.]